MDSLARCTVVITDKLGRSHDKITRTARAWSSDSGGSGTASANDNISLASPSSIPGASHEPASSGPSGSSGRQSPRRPHSECGSGATLCTVGQQKLPQLHAACYRGGSRAVGACQWTLRVKVCVHKDYWRSAVSPAGAMNSCMRQEQSTSTRIALQHACMHHAIYKTLPIPSHPILLTMWIPLCDIICADMTTRLIHTVINIALLLLTTRGCGRCQGRPSCRARRPGHGGRPTGCQWKGRHWGEFLRPR